jgi:HEAT repeat protein
MSIIHIRLRWPISSVKKLGEINHLNESLPEIVRLGEPVIPYLEEYLAGNPESIPHSRVAAVQALSLIGTKEAIDILKKILFKYDLNEIHPACIQAEYVVKNTIIERLLQLKPDEPYVDFIEAFRRYRLSAAIVAIVKFHLLKAIPSLIESLEDNVIASRAAEGLRQLGQDSVPVLCQELSFKHLFMGSDEPRISRQRRVFSAITLGDIGDKRAIPALKQMLLENDPNITAVAVAALIKLNATPISLNEAKLLWKGVLSPEWIVAEQCRNSIAQLGEVGVQAAPELIPLKSLPEVQSSGDRFQPVDLPD